MYFNSTADEVVSPIQEVLYWERVIRGVLIGLCVIMGIIGNLMIILATIFSRILQTPTNAFVTNLAVADLLTSLSLIWTVVSLLSVDDWPIPEAYWLCQMSGFMVLVCLGASMYNLSVIAVSRLILITRPSLYKKIFSSWKLVLLVSIPWIIPVATVIAVLATGNGAVGYDTKEGCGDIDTHKNAEVFRHVQLGVAFPIPLVAIVVSYIWIYVYLKRHFHTQKQLTVIEEDAEACSTSSSNDTTDKQNPLTSIQLHAIEEDRGENTQRKATRNDPRRDRISHQQIRITKNLSFVVCAFFACFTPYFIISPFAEQSFLAYRIKFYVAVLICANSAINFFIYARKHPDFKVVFGHMLRLSFADIPKPSRFLKFLLALRK